MTPLSRTLIKAALLLLPAYSAQAEDWSLHYQATAVPQAHLGFESPVFGINSLSGPWESRTSLTATLFLGARLWHSASQGAELYVNPELAAGSGLSGTHGMAGFPNGEIFRVDSPDPKLSVARVYLKQVVGLGAPDEKLEPDKNQLGGAIPLNRVTLAVGKFSLNDFFDNNRYSHDPRTQFLNWSLMDNGAWDYAADTRGYTWAFYTELNTARWAVRLALAMEPAVANGLEFDTDLAQAHGENLEFEYRYALAGHPGIWRLLSYLNHAHMGSYEEALAESPTAPDVTTTRAYREKYGFGLNIEQELTEDLGLFMRAGWNDGVTETWAFTEVDRTLSFGVARRNPFGHPKGDVLAVALIINGLSVEHAAYLTAGGSGFMIGDGTVAYAPEQIVEADYAVPILTGLGAAVDYQLAVHPGYNSLRGPAHVFAIRLHYEN